MKIICVTTQLSKQFVDNFLFGNVKKNGNFFSGSNGWPEQFFGQLVFSIVLTLHSIINSNVRLILFYHNSVDWFIP
jgi:hypothetical protein